jgi:hypothetical protein
MQYQEEELMEGEIYRKTFHNPEYKWIVRATKEEGKFDVAILNKKEDSYIIMYPTFTNSSSTYTDATWEEKEWLRNCIENNCKDNSNVWKYYPKIANYSIY